jgi:heme exporter protein B
VWREARLVAGKDLRIELRSRVGIGQVAPFAVLVLVLFGFALSGDTRTLRTYTGGLFWVTVLFSAVLAIQRAFSIESTDGNRDALRMSGMDPAAIFLGKAAALVLQLLALEVVLGAAVLVFYDPDIETPLLLLVTALVATLGVAAAGTIYGVLAAGLRVRETILPILLLPVLAPVLIGATRAFDDALGAVAVDGWNWVGLLALAAVIYVAFGALAFGVLLEES